MNDDILVAFEFTNGVLSIRCNGNTLVVAGKGASWPQQVTIAAGELRKLPKRLMDEEVCLFVGDTHLSIGNRSYVRVMNGTDRPRDQGNR
jgi:hypothetical protein